MTIAQTPSAARAREKNRPACDTRQIPRALHCRIRICTTCRTNMANGPRGSASNDGAWPGFGAVVSSQSKTGLNL